MSLYVLYEVIKSYSKEKVDKYSDKIKNKIELAENIRNNLVPLDAPFTIVCNIGHPTINQFIVNIFTRFPTTV